MLHDVALDDVIGGHQAYIHRKKDLFMAHRILHRAKTTRGSRDARGLCVRRDYKLAALAAASFVKLSNFQNILIFTSTFTDSSEEIFLAPSAANKPETTKKAAKTV